VCATKGNAEDNKKRDKRQSAQNIYLPPPPKRKKSMETLYVAAVTVGVGLRERKRHSGRLLLLLSVVVGIARRRTVAVGHVVQRLHITMQIEEGKRRRKKKRQEIISTNKSGQGRKGRLCLHVFAQVGAPSLENGF
jgi:hypothetical protein